MTIAINGRYEESKSITDVQQIFDYIKYKNNRVLEMKLYDKQGKILCASQREELELIYESQSYRYSRTG